MAKASKPKVKGVVERVRDKRVLRQTTVYLPIDVWKRLRHRSVDEDREISELLTEAARRYLDQT